MMTALASGAFLGLACGLAPGPLLALLLAQTLRHGPREGCKVALAPLVCAAAVPRGIETVGGALAVVDIVAKGSSRLAAVTLKLVPHPLALPRWRTQRLRNRQRNPSGIAIT
jgi:threonine/homoserine/homoserine lactone efflux protein